MVRPVLHTATPSADAAAVLRRIGFALLFFAVPLGALLSRRAVVVLAPVAMVLIVLAAALDGGAKHLRDRLTGLLFSPGGLAGAVLLLWTALSLVWTPFPAEASERLLNITGMAVAVLAGYLAMPERMRSANLYILPVGVGLAALLGMVLAFEGVHSLNPEEEQSLERGMIVLALMLWPALAWLHSRGRNLESLGLALLVAVAALLTADGLALHGLAVGAVIFALTAMSARIGSRLTALVMAGLLLVAPVLPFILHPLSQAWIGPRSPVTAALAVWRQLVSGDPLRLLTGHGLETALRGRIFGLLPPQSPSTLLFEIWFELGLVGAVAGALLLYRSAAAAGHCRASLAPAIVAAFATAFALGCMGIGTAQVWWLTALALVALAFVAVERGQFRTKRPKATFRRKS